MVFIFDKSCKLLDYKSVKWRFLHNVAKPLLEAAVTAVYKECEDIIKAKDEKGWVNPEIKLLYENWGEMIKKDVDMGVYKTAAEWDHIREFMEKLRAIVCCQLDEDSHFLMRTFYFLDILFRDQELYRIEWHKNKAYWDWEKIRKKLISNDENWKQAKARKAGKAAHTSSYVQ